MVNGGSDSAAPDWSQPDGRGGGTDKGADGTDAWDAEKCRKELEAALEEQKRVHEVEAAATFRMAEAEAAAARHRAEVDARRRAFEKEALRLREAGYAFTARLTGPRALVNGGGAQAGAGTRPRAAGGLFRPRCQPRGPLTGRAKYR